MGETVIKLENVKKQYRLGVIGGGTLQGDLQSLWAKIRRKDDPNTTIDSKIYSKNEKFLALDGINLEVKRGDTLGLIGGNGAGKSTTLKLLSRVTAPSEGTIYINGKISSMLEVGTGFHGELTGRENIYMNGAILGMKKNEITEKIDEIIEFSECEKFIDTPVKRYSSGMFVKLAFAVAAHLNSDILLMDEVLAVGDMKFQKKCIDKMLSIAKSGRTIIYVSHNMSTIRQLCNRCAVMSKGKIIYDGDVEPAIDLYLSSAKMKKGIHMDFQNAPRPNFLTDKIHFESLDVLDKETPTYCDGENVKVRIRFKTLKDIKNLSIRMMIHNEDQSPIATTGCYNFMECDEGKTYEKEFSFDVSPLSTGVYKILMVAFETDDIGSVIDADAVWPALVFDREKTSTLNWKSRLFGDVELSDMMLVER